VQKPVDVAHQTGQHRIGAGIQGRRDVAAVEHDAIVGSPLHHAGDSEPRVGRRDVRLLQELKTQAPDLDQRRPVERCVAVLDFELSRGVSREAIGSGGAQVGFIHAGPANGESQHHESVPQGGRDVQRRRQRVARRTVERRTVWEHAPRAPDGELAQLEEGIVQRQLEESPRVWVQGAGSQLDIRFEVTVVLLEVLWLEERAFGPEDPVVPAHGPPYPLT
jgi:hypothetical protein